MLIIYSLSCRQTMFDGYIDLLPLLLIGVWMRSWIFGSGPEVIDIFCRLTHPNAFFDSQWVV